MLEQLGLRPGRAVRWPNPGRRLLHFGLVAPFGNRAAQRSLRIQRVEDHHPVDPHTGRAERRRRLRAAVLHRVPGDAEQVALVGRRVGVPGPGTDGIGRNVRGVHIGVARRVADPLDVGRQATVPGLSAGVEQPGFELGRRGGMRGHGDSTAQHQREARRRDAHECSSRSRLLRRYSISVNAGLPALGSIRASFVPREPIHEPRDLSIAASPGSTGPLARSAWSRPSDHDVRPA